MKNRKRILAMILAGFLSVTTAFQITSAVAFATDVTEMSVEAASTETSEAELPAEAASLDSSTGKTNEIVSDVVVDEKSETEKTDEKPVFLAGAAECA